MTLETPVFPRSVRQHLARLAAVIAVGVNAAALQAQAARTEFREVHLGMEVRIVLADTAGGATAGGATASTATADRATRAAHAAYARIAALEATLSDWRPNSELRRLERSRRDQWVSVSADLAVVLALALDVARATDGRFDPTVGPLTRLWRDAARTGQPIRDSDRADALRRVGYRALVVDEAGRRVRLRRDSMALDLGAIAKGFIVDEALAVLRREGVSAALIEAGGDIATFGVPAGTTGWRVAVARQRGDTVVLLRDGAISTSGDAAQRIGRPDGTSESHVFLPASGRGISRSHSVTVIGPRAALTDALATALMLVPPAAAQTLADRYGVRVITIEPVAPDRP